MTTPARWLGFAGEDLMLAQAALQHDIPNQACFHAQQGVEKALKGFLRSRDRSVPKTHALTELLTICRSLDETFAQLEETCLKLDPYYVVTRYPDALPEATSEGLPTRGEAEDAVTLLRAALDWIKVKIR